VNLPMLYAKTTLNLSVLYIACQKKRMISTGWVLQEENDTLYLDKRPNL
jgi:hypothetical protein